MLTTSWALIGLVASVIGVQLNGLSGWWAVVNWALAGLAALGLAFVLLGALATTEGEEDAALADQIAGQGSHPKDSSAFRALSPINPPTLNFVAPPKKFERSAQSI